MNLVPVQAAPRLPRPKEVVIWLFPAHCDRLLRHEQILTALSELCGVALTWHVGVNGKPELRGKTPSNQLPYVSLAHSASWCILGLTYLAPIGIDLEAPRELKHALQKRCFADLELLEIGRSEADLARALWCIKESYVKATGTGIAIGLKHLVWQAQQLHWQNDNDVRRDLGAHTQAFTLAGADANACASTLYRGALSLLTESPRKSCPFAPELVVLQTALSKEL